MRRFRLPTVLLLATAVPAAADAQDSPYPTYEEYAEAAERAGSAPLFATQEPLRLTLRTDIDWLRDERSDSTEVEGAVLFHGEGGEVIERFVNTRARGNFRRDSRNCNFPPLRLNFRTSEMEGTVFEGQDKLKLVTPCNDGRDDYQRYIFNEYLAYRVLNTVTDASFRVRLVEITYEDVTGEYDTRTKIGFLIEDEDELAARLMGTLEDVAQFHPLRADGTYSVTVALFNYLIANTDWSPVYFHNVRLVRTEDARYLTIPYDFDQSGIVNARYAKVDPSLHDRIRRVRQRLFRGFCREELQHASAVAPFAARRGEIEALFTDFAALGYEQFENDEAEDTIDFLEDFWRVVDDEGRFRSQITRHCRPVQGD